MFALGFILYSQKVNKSICFVKLTGYRKIRALNCYDKINEDQSDYKTELYPCYSNAVVRKIKLVSILNLY